MTADFQPFPAWLRFYVYGIHGFAIEVMFTAAWEFVVSVNWKWPAVTNVWSFFIYGSSGMMTERLYFSMRHSLPMPVRAVVYVVWTFFWEFTTGFILTQFNACPWDYTQFNWNIMGLITLEYTPAWCFMCLVAEQLIIRTLFRSYTGPELELNSFTAFNKVVKRKES